MHANDPHHGVVEPSFDGDQRPQPTTSTVARELVPDVVPGLASESAPAAALPQATATRDASAPSAADVADDPLASMRVGVRELDALANLVGELVLTRNQLLQSLSAPGENASSAITQRLDLVTSELQEGLMRLRMQPIGSAWSELSAHSRAFAAQLGKRTRAKLDGVDIELDRTVLDGLRPPLRALLELLIRHSLEEARERERLGKPADARIWMRAVQENGRVVVDISDDGRGLDESSEEARAEFRAAQAAVARIGAECSLRPAPAGGACVRITIPLTLAITPALLVSAGGERFAIGQASLVELVRVSRSDARQIEELAGGSVYRLRESLLPVVDLRSVLDLSKSADSTREASPLVVIQFGAERFGLAVDEIHDTEEIVVKALDPSLQKLGLFSGATVLGDGNVSLILDVVGIGRAAGLTLAEADPEAPESCSEGDRASPDRWLIFELPGQRRMALPLARVQRLEEFEAASIERSGDTRVVQYRDSILPLFETAHELGLRDAGAGSGDGGLTSVVVIDVGERHIGLVAQRIVDILEGAPTAERSRPREGVALSAVLGGAVTDVIDIAWIAERCGGDRHAATTAASSASEETTLATRQLCTFRVGSLQLAADVGEVQEVLRTPRLTRVPRAARQGGGLINLRGQTVLTIDLVERFEHGAERAESSGEMVVVFNGRDGAFAARVDSVGDVIDVDPACLESAPRHGRSQARSAVRELYKLPDSLLLVLDVDRLLDAHAADFEAPPPPPQIPRTDARP
jgi:two-component system chemotaxis sensor kinase CheA